MNDVNSDPTYHIGHKHIGNVIHFVHVATTASCHFKAFLTSWEDNFKQDWNSYETVGRMDPIKTYKRTSRTINFGFDIPSYSFEDAVYNLNEVQTLIQMSYPTFIQNTITGQQVNSQEQAQNSAAEQKALADQNQLFKQQKGVSLANTVSHMVSPPLLILKFSNWLNDPSKDPAMSTTDALGSPLGHGSGLYGTIENVKFSPDLSENGGFYGSLDLAKYNLEKGPNDLVKKPTNKNENILVPKLLKLDIVFNVLHTNDLGYYSSTGEVRTQGFPYNADRIKVKVR